MDNLIFFQLRHEMQSVRLTSTTSNSDERGASRHDISAQINSPRTHRTEENFSGSMNDNSSHLDPSEVQRLKHRNTLLEIELTRYDVLSYRNASNKHPGAYLIF